jgi:phenylpyruvate tautomerase PptA (4-oxalocrotonate tautomerase family)
VESAGTVCVPSFLPIEEASMPFVRIDMVQGKSADYRRTIGEVVYDAIIDVLKAPKDDHFQVVSEHPSENLIADKKYLGIERTSDCVFIQLKLNAGRSVEQKRGFYKAVADGLHERLGLRREDVFTSLVEVPKENTKAD